MKRYDVDSTFDRLLEQGKLEGQLSVTSIVQAFEETDILPEQLDKFLEKCSEVGIEIDNQTDINEEANLTDKVFDSSDNDLSYNEVKAYLNEIGKIPNW